MVGYFLIQGGYGGSALFSFLRLFVIFRVTLPRSKLKSKRYEEGFRLSGAGGSVCGHG